MSGLGAQVQRVRPDAAGVQLGVPHRRGADVHAAIPVAAPAAAEAGAAVSVELAK